MKPIHSKLLTRNPSAATWVLAALYALLVVHLSLYPYTGWRDIGVGPWEYFAGPWIPLHQRLLWTDIALNVLGYWPLGVLLTLGALQTGYRRWMWLTLPLCCGLSAGLEAIQTYLISRVPSKMDLLTNLLGALAGFLTVYWINHQPRHRKWLTLQLDVWLVQRAWLGVGLLSLWLLSLLSPQHPDYVTGYWLGNLLNSLGLGTEGWLSQLNATQLTWIEQNAPGLSNYCFLCCAWCIGLAQTQAQAPRLRLLTLLVVCSVMLRVVARWVEMPNQLLGAIALEFQQDNFVSMGLAWGLVAFLTLTRMPHYWAARVGLIHLLAGWLLTLLLPGFFDPILNLSGTGIYRAFASLHVAAQWVSEVWPLLAVGVLIFLSKREHHFAG